MNSQMTNILATSIIGLFFTWPAFFIFTLVLFRQNVKSNRSSILLSSIFMSIVSLIVHYTFLESFMSLIMLTAVVCCSYFFFTWNLSHSLLLSVISVVLFALLESVLYVIESQIQGVRFIQAAQEYKGYHGVIMGFAHLLLSWLLSKKRIGFTFISPRKRTLRKRQNHHNNDAILLFAVLYLSSLSLTLFHFEEFIVINLVLLIPTLFIIVRKLYMKEQEEG
ncbi:hypothetical protein [Paenibacillus mucilaginosus]|nr:hypothetical protein [Paenibacillus mucilaginosus]MCG7215706.1 hypothetical protein [Paenibacillus mucilaginosus]WDM29339.1 hypothetical protein KCX80_09345 [Paenibacillus mucilaginosus]